MIGDVTHILHGGILDLMTMFRNEARDMLFFCFVMSEIGFRNGATEFGTTRGAFDFLFATPIFTIARP
jgi:hypothetical protein